MHSKIALLTSEVRKLADDLRKEFMAQSGLTAEEFTKKIESNLSASLQRWTKARAIRSVGTMVVQIDFAYTESTAHVDQLNAPSTRILVQGWGKEGPAEKVQATSLRSNKVPKLRKSSGTTERVSKSIINWFKKNEKALISGEPYKGK